MWPVIGKSYSSSGILYWFTPVWTNGNACAQAGHSRSSHSRIASFAPAGGLNIEVSTKWSTWFGGMEVWATAAAETKEPNKAMARRRLRPEGRTRKNLWSKVLLFFY